MGKSRSSGPEWQLNWEEHDSREARTGSWGKKAKFGNMVQTQEFSGKMRLCTKHLRDRKHEMKEKEPITGTGEKQGYSHQQHTAMLMDTCNMGMSLLREAVSGVTSTAVSHC